MAEPTDPWNSPAFLRDVQYRTDENLAARQSIYVYQHPRLDLQARVIDLAAPAPGATVADVGCGNGAYLAELARRRFAGRVLGLDMSLGMLAAAHDRLTSSGSASPAGAPARSGPACSADAPAPRPTAGPSGSAGAPLPFGGGDRANSARPPITGSVGAAAPQPTAGSSGSSESPRRVALIAADATALPLPDGVADLTLAMHMLYHVPDPSQAVRELRRVTRPGGRVVIGLNAPDHLRELREIVAAARGDGRWGGRRERLTLDDGEALARASFSAVARHDFVTELRVPDPQPIADYVRSMSGTQHGADPERLVAAVVARFPAGPGAVLTITAHPGCLICEV